MSKPELITNEQAERAYLVGIEVHKAASLFSVDDSLSELALLAKTAGLEVVGKTFQRLRTINTKTFIGSRKVDEIVDEISLIGVNVIVFDEELSPRHQRELEKQFGENDPATGSIGINPGHICAACSDQRRRVASRTGTIRISFAALD